MHEQIINVAWKRDTNNRINSIMLAMGEMKSKKLELKSLENL